MTDPNPANPDPASNPNPNPGANPNPANPSNPAPSWWQSLDLGDAAKEQSTATILNGFKTPVDLVKSLSALKETGDLAKDWRRTLAGDDEKEYAHLQRFSTLADYHKSGVEARKKISSGDLAKPLPKDATAEQVAEWRKGNGIPEKPAGYWDGQLPNGLVIGADDKPMFDAVAEVLHANNVRPEAAHGIAKWYYDMQDAAVEKATKADKEQAQAATDVLRHDWGQDYRANINVAMSFLDTLGPELKPLVMDATLPDGTRMFNKPEVMKWIVAQAREINPAAHITPAGTDGGINGVQSEIDKIETFMKTNRTAYNNDTKMQERLRTLYDARIKLQSRGRAA